MVWKTNKQKQTKKWEYLFNPTSRLYYKAKTIKTEQCFYICKQNEIKIL